MNIKVIIICILLAVAAFADSGNKKPGKKVRESADRTTEKTVFVDISLGNGVIYLERGPGDKVFDGEFTYTNQPPEVNYEVVGNDGHLIVRFDYEKRKYKGDEHKFTNLSSLDELYENECQLKLSPDLPLDLNLDFGVVKGELKLGGLQLEEINFVSGVSKTKISFEEPNPILLEYFDVEAGVGSLEIYRLGNANFKNFKFEGGIGNYVIDFAGKNYKETKVDIEVGLGKVDLYLPRDAGVRMKVEKSFLCSFDIDHIYKENDFYYNDEWGKTTNSLDMNLDTGVGKVSVVWIDGGE